MKKLYALLITPVILSPALNKAAEKLPKAPGGPKELVYTKQEAQYFINGDFKQLARENPDRAVAIWRQSEMDEGSFLDSLLYLKKTDLNKVRRGFVPFGKLIFPPLGTDATKEVKSGMISFSEDNVYKPGDCVVVKRKGDPEYTWAVVLIKTSYYDPKRPNEYIVQISEDGTDYKTIVPSEKGQTIGRLK